MRGDRLLVSGLSAAYLPARAAANVDPMKALRNRVNRPVSTTIRFETLRRDRYKL